MTIGSVKENLRSVTTMIVHKKIKIPFLFGSSGNYYLKILHIQNLQCKRQSTFGVHLWMITQISKIYEYLNL